MIQENNIFTSFIKRHQLVIASALLALFSLHLALTYRKEDVNSSLAHEVLSVLTAPFQYAAKGAYGAGAHVWSGYINLIGVNEENESLKKDMALLQAQINRLKEESILAARLKTVVDYREAAGFSTIPATIIGYKIDGWARTVTINKGAAEGIIKDRAVITPGGVAGMVIEVNRHTSKVLLNTDLRSNIDAIVQRSRVKGIVEGNGKDMLVLKYIQQPDDVQVGDTVLTSGLSGIFPKGLIIGEVTKVEKSGDNFFKQIEIRPMTDIRKVEEVLVIKDDGFTGEE